MPIPRGQEETEQQDCQPHGASEGQHCKNNVELSAVRIGLLVGNERKLHADEILKEIEWLKKPLILMILNYSCDLLDFWSYTVGLKVPITIISEMTPYMNISISETFNYSWFFLLLQTT